MTMRKMKPVTLNKVPNYERMLRLKCKSERDNTYTKLILRQDRDCIKENKEWLYVNVVMNIPLFDVVILRRSDGTRTVLKDRFNIQA